MKLNEVQMFVPVTFTILVEMLKSYQFRTVGHIVFYLKNMFTMFPKIFLKIPSILVLKYFLGQPNEKVIIKTTNPDVSFCWLFL